MDDADLFQYRRHEEVGPLQNVQHYSGDDRITEEEADNQKEGPVTDASQNRDAGVVSSCPIPGPPKKKRKLSEGKCGR